MRLPRTHPSQTPKNPADELRVAMLAALKGKKELAVPDLAGAGRPLAPLQTTQPLQPILGRTPRG